MWVSVVAVAADGIYSGRLANEPAVLTELSYGDRIDFAADNVIAIEYSADELGYDPHAAAMIDARIVKEDLPPKYVALGRAPDAAESTWFASLDPAPPADRRTITLGELTDRWPELVPVFSSGLGYWEREDDGPHYKQTRAPDS
jgi:uncharacterized protein YegJ (DUF2314 family)